MSVPTTEDVGILLNTGDYVLASKGASEVGTKEPEIAEIKKGLNPFPSIRAVVRSGVIKAYYNKKLASCDAR